MPTQLLRRRRRSKQVETGGSTAPGAPARSGSLQSRFWFWLITAAMLAAIGVGATQLDWPSVVAALSNADPAWFAAACVAFMTLPVLMAVEWRLIGARSPADGGDLRTLLPLGCFTYFLQSYLNAAVAYGAALLRLVRGRGWTIGQGIGLVTVDQIAEGCSRIGFCGIVLWSATGSEIASPWVAVAIGVAALALLLPLAVYGKSLLRSSISRRLSRLGYAVGVLDEVAAILRFRSFAWGVTLAMTKKIAKISAVMAIERALGLETSPWTALYFMAMLECATTLPLVPGNLGVIESTAAGVYATQGFSAEVGLSVGILYHAGVYLATAVMAAAAAAAKAASSRRIAATQSAAGRLTTPAFADTVETATLEPRSSAA
jgi:glycosyltransferase 2 family protein